MKVVDITAMAVPFDAEIVESLRYLADELEAGRIRHVMVGSLADGGYRIKASCSPHEGLIIATLLQRAAVDRHLRWAARMTDLPQPLTPARNCNG